MDLTETMELEAPADEVYAVVADLGRYPDWLTIVPRSEPENADPTENAEVAWSVDLRARLGPLSRAKRLRMVRTVEEPPHHARFERRERDGREHAPWVLDAVVESRDVGSVLTMSLHYGGNLWVPMLDRLLRQEIERSRLRLSALLGRRS